MKDIRIYSKEEENGEYSVVVYIPEFLEGTYKDAILKNLQGFSESDWKGGSYDTYEIPRLQRWYHEDGKMFNEKWSVNYDRWKPHVYEGWLKDLQDHVESRLDVTFEDLEKFKGFKIPKFNSVLLNYYKNGTSGIGYHKDTAESLGDNPTIVSLSIGQARKFSLRRSLYDPENIKYIKINEDEKVDDLEFELESGSLILMGGACQKYYVHSIIKDRSIENPRYNFTFRDCID